MSLSKTLPIKEKILSFFFTNREEDYYFLLFFRVAIGLFTLLHFLSIAKDFDVLFSNAGLVPLEITALFKTKWLPTTLDFTALMKLVFGLSPGAAWMVYKVAYALFCVLLITGTFTRLSSFTLMILHIMLFQGSRMYMYGVDYFTSISLFYCFIFPVGYAGSIDNLFRKRVTNPSPYRKLLQIHITLVYFSSGFDKLIGINWWNGESIWKAVHLPSFNSDFALNYDLMAHYPLIPIMAGWGTIFIELLYPFFTWPQKTRTLWLTLTIGLHIGIIITLKLYFFGFLMILLNLSAFLNLKKNAIAPLRV
jgi:hypothetical protein